MKTSNEKKKGKCGNKRGCYRKNVKAIHKKIPKNLNVSETTKVRKGKKMYPTPGKRKNSRKKKDKELQKKIKDMLQSMPIDKLPSKPWKRIDKFWCLEGVVWRGLRRCVQEIFETRNIIQKHLF